MNSLGLEAAALQAMEPEAAWRAVVEAIQEIPNVADRATAAEEIFGGTSEKLAGIVNLTTAEFAALEAEVQKTSDIWSGDALASAKEFDQEVNNLKTDLTRGSNALAVSLLPALTDVTVYLRQTALPAFQDFKNDILEPIIGLVKDVGGAFLDFATGPLADTATKVADRVMPVLSDLYDIFEKDIWPLLRDVVIPLWVDLVEKKLTLIKGVYDNVLKPALQALVDIFQTVLVPLIQDKVIPAIKDLADKIMPKIKEAWENVIKPALDALIAVLKVAIPEAIGFVRDKFEVFKSYFSGFSTGVTADSQDLSNRMVSAFQVVSTFIDNRLIPIFEEIYEYVWPLIEETWNEHLKPTFEALVAFIRDDIIPWIKENRAVFEAAWAAIELVVVGVLKNVLLSIETTIGVMSAVIRGLIDLIRGDWSGAWEEIKKVVEEVLEFIVGTFENFGIDLEKIWEDTWGSIKRSFNRIVDPIIARVKSLLALVRRAKNAVSNLPGAGIVKSALRLPARLRRRGTELQRRACHRGRARP